ncbi:MAG: ABC transporter ATP-binding protein, partial [Firmicutes bacterium]|nr:ABC transporter ATP-binding protein [Bacillota bacterium]
MKNTLNSYLKWLWLQLKGSRALYVLSIFFSGINNFVMPTAMSWFIKEALSMVEREKSSGLGKKVLIVVVVILLGNLLHLLFTYTKTKVVETTMHQIRLQFFRKARKLPMSYYDQNQQGKVMSISLQNMQWMQRSLDTELVSFASRALTIGGGMLIVFIWQWQIGLVYLLIGSIGIGAALWV